MLRLPIAATAALLAVPTAAAAPWGNPVADPRAARGAVGATAEWEQQLALADGCVGSGCEAVWRPLLIGGRVAFAPARGVGLSGGLQWAGDRIAEASHDGRGLAGWAGLDLALPLDPAIWAALCARFERGRTTGAGSRADWTDLGVAAFLAWAPEDHSFALYGGPMGTPVAARAVRLDDPAVALDLAPAARLGAVVGLELRSSPLGLPWARSRSALTAGAELRAESGLGGAIWIGLGF